MNKYVYIGAVVLLLLGCITACRTHRQATASFSDLDGEWNVIEMNGKQLDPAVTHPIIGIEAAAHRLYGNAGCNRMMGQIEYSDSHKNIIKFPHIGTTRMACPDMSGENELLKTLSEVVRFEAVGDKKPVTQIALYNLTNKKLLVLQRK